MSKVLLFLALLPGLAMAQAYAPSGGGGAVSGVFGDGGFIPYWTAATTLGSSNLVWDPTNARLSDGTANNSPTFGGTTVSSLVGIYSNNMPLDANTNTGVGMSIRTFQDGGVNQTDTGLLVETISRGGDNVGIRVVPTGISGGAGGTSDATGIRISPYAAFTTTTNKVSSLTGLNIDTASLDTNAFATNGTIYGLLIGSNHANISGTRTLYDALIGDPNSGYGTAFDPSGIVSINGLPAASGGALQITAASASNAVTVSEGSRVSINGTTGTSYLANDATNHGWSTKSAVTNAASNVAYLYDTGTFTAGTDRYLWQYNLAGTFKNYSDTQGRIYSVTGFTSTGTTGNGLVLNSTKYLLSNTGSSIQNFNSTITDDTYSGIQAGVDHSLFTGTTNASSNDGEVFEILNTHSGASNDGAQKYRVLVLGRGSQSASGDTARAVGREYLGIGRNEYGATAGDYYGIGFGYSGGATGVRAAEVGFVSTDNSGSTKGDMYIATRNSTTGGTNPTIRFKVKSDGTVSVVDDPVLSVHAEQLTTNPAAEFGSDAGNTGALSVTFGRAFTGIPSSCTCSDNNGTAVLGCGVKAKSSTGATFVLTTAAGTDSMDWQCFGTR